MKNLKWISGMLLIASILIGCGESRDTSAKRQRQEEQAITNDYLDALKENDPSLEPDSTGVYVIDHKIGTGDSIKRGDKVHVYYYGMMCDTALFDANIYGDFEYGSVPDFETVNYYDPFEFTVGAGQVISGWDLAIQSMKPGGVAQWIIPEGLGYGSNPSSSYIRPYATLVFFVKVDKVYPVETDE